MTATLYHARPLLAAALCAGFRESGVQSLKALDDPNASPMVAIRTAGLGFSSVVGMLRHVADREGPCMVPLVSEEYWDFMIQLANERFGANRERIERLTEELKRHDLLAREEKDDRNRWEDKATRESRKREEGLRRQLEKLQVEGADDTAKAKEKEGFVDIGLELMRG